MIRLEDVVLTYGDRVALTVPDLELPTAAVVGVIGPNGSGKSTFLAALSGLLRPRSGRVEVLGVPPVQARERIAHVLQETPASTTVPLTVREVVRMGRYARLGPFRPFRAADHDAVDRAMDRAGVSDLADRQLHELSGGQRQRVYLAQGLAQEADVLLLDEPATGLDLDAEERIGRAIREEQAAGRTVVYTSHDVATVADADVGVLLAGRLVAAGDPSEVLVAEHLREAYGGRFQITERGSVILDDPHHHGGVPRGR